MAHIETKVVLSNANKKNVNEVNKDKIARVDIEIGNR